MGRLGLIVLCLISFFGGVYAWRVQRTGRKVDNGDASESRQTNRRATLVVIGGSPLSTEDIEFEYNLLTDTVKSELKRDNARKDVPSPLTAIPDLGPKLDHELSPLKQRLASQIIERKLLYKFIEQERKFDIQDPARFSKCLKEWEETVAASKANFTGRDAQERLKKMLCERGIIAQYMQAVPFAAIQITDAEVTEYYKSHPKEFKIPEQAIIRHIALSAEKDAISIRRELNQGNFAAMAAKYSNSPEKEKGGLLGPFSQGQMPQVFDIAFSMRPGEIRGILKSTYGFHFVMLERRIPRQDQNLAQATPKIRETLMAKKREEVYQKWVEQALNVVTVVTPKPLW